MIERDKYAYCAVSSRVRLARNLADFPFCGKPAREMNGEIITLVTRTLKPLGDFYLQLMSELGREPTHEELAVKLAMPVEKVRKVMKVAKDPISLETPIGDEDESHPLRKFP